MNESLKKDIKDLSREELERIFIEEVEQCDKFQKVICTQIDEIYRLNRVLDHLEKYFSDREYYEFANVVRDTRKANIEWLEGSNNDN